MLILVSRKQEKHLFDDKQGNSESFNVPVWREEALMVSGLARSHAPVVNVH